MTKTNREGLLVARQPGTRLLLAGGPRMSPAFEGPSERTIFFRPETVEKELKAMKLLASEVELRKASVSITLE